MQSRLDQEYFRQPDHTRSIQETNVTFQALQWSLSVIALILKPMDSWMIVRRFQTPISFAKQAVLQPTSANFNHQPLPQMDMSWHFLIFPPKPQLSAAPTDQVRRPSSPPWSQAEPRRVASAPPTVQSDQGGPKRGWVNWRIFWFFYLSKLVYK